MHMQERLLEDDEEGGLPGLDLSDSDDDATWNPQMDKPANDMRSRYVQTGGKSLLELWVTTFLLCPIYLKLLVHVL